MSIYLQIKYNNMTFQLFRYGSWIFMFCSDLVMFIYLYNLNDVNIIIKCYGT